MKTKLLHPADCLTLTALAMLPLVPDCAGGAVVHDQVTVKVFHIGNSAVAKPVTIEPTLDGWQLVGIAGPCGEDPNLDVRGKQRHNHLKHWRNRLAYPLPHVAVVLGQSAVKVYADLLAHGQQSAR